MSMESNKYNVAILGAGLTGLTCASHLLDSGKFNISIFETSCAPGGRMKTRRESDLKQFDHGAQYITVRNPLFQQQVDIWLKYGLVEPWKAKLASVNFNADKSGCTVERDNKELVRYVGVPEMSSITRFISDKLSELPAVDIHFNTRVKHLNRTQMIDGSVKWKVELQDVESQNETEVEKISSETKEFEKEFDFVVLTLPFPQAIELLANTVPASSVAGMADPLRMLVITIGTEIKFHSCWTTMLTLQPPLEDLIPYDGLYVNYQKGQHSEEPEKTQVLSWVARDSSKPQRLSSTTEEYWVLLASPTFSDANVDKSPEEVAPAIIEDFKKVIQFVSGKKDIAFQTCDGVSYCWKHSLPEKTVIEPENPASELTLNLVPGADGKNKHFYFCHEYKVGFAGDWASGSGVEGAFLSGYFFAEHLIALAQPTVTVAQEYPVVHL